MLAYVFWHQPRHGGDAVAYEDAQRAFHARLEVPSASFRLAQLPFLAEPGYEDWYLVDDWQHLGDLNAAAVDTHRRSEHDVAAALAGRGWAGVYRLLRGPGSPPVSARWLDKPPGRPIDGFLDSERATAAWQRQMTLGPAPEFCLDARPAGAERTPVWPP